MYKNSLAILAGLLIVLTLSFLIVESRAVKDEYYASHADRTRAIETIETDLVTAAEVMQGAFDTGRSIPLSLDLTFVRLSATNERLQKAVDIDRADIEMQSVFVGFGDELHQLIAAGMTFVAKQNAMSEALRSVQETAPALVRELRESDLPGQSQLVFTLAIDLIEFVTDHESAGAARIYERIEESRLVLSPGSDAVSRADSLLNAAKSVVDEHTAAEMSLTAVRNSSAAASLSALSNAVLAANSETVRRAERAQLLLSICAVLLLLGAIYALVRLQASYRELNRSNAELERANSGLEERVAVRTELLTKSNDDLKASQSQLIHAEKMSSLGQMVAGISHEINTPLWYLMNNSSVIQERLELVSELCEIASSMTNAVRSRADVKVSIQRGLIDMDRMLKDGIEDDIDEAKSLIQDSIFGLEELTSLAQGLKDFSRLDRAIEGQFNVNEGLDKALLIASNKIKNRIDVHKYYGDVPSVHCSPSQINQIFLNLLTNAADAIEDRGDIVIQTWEEEGNVGISIADSGVGIPAEVLPSIRDPFFTTKDVGKGTGLGLSIVDQIITKHEGEFRIESESGKGTCVTVLIPISMHATKAVGVDDDIDTQLIDVAVIASARGTNQMPDDSRRLLSA